MQGEKDCQGQEGKHCHVQIKPKGSPCDISIYIYIMCIYIYVYIYIDTQYSRYTLLHTYNYVYSNTHTHTLYTCKYAYVYISVYENLIWVLILILSSITAILSQKQNTLSKFSRKPCLPHSKKLFKPLSEKYQSPWKVHHLYIIVYLSFLDRFGVLRCPCK